MSSNIALPMNAMIKATFLAAVLLIAGSNREAGAAPTMDELVQQFEAQIDAWDVAAASSTLKTLDASATPEHQASLRSLRSILAFYSGDYRQARSLLDQARDPEQIKDGGFSLAEVIRKTEEAFRESPQTRFGHFEARYKPGVDVVLVGDLFAELEDAYRFFEKLLGFSPDAPIRVEVFSDYDAFRHATTLTEKDLEVSGAVGVCKFNKLMVLSPRLLLRGYRYLNTAVHEYVHFLVYHLTRNNAPVWLHEGIASYLEDLFDRERGSKNPGAIGPDAFRSRLQPSSETLLATAVQNNTLIPYSRMHPSLVKLDTREEVALAFAQVQVAVEFLMTRTEGKGLGRLLKALGEGKELSAALQQVVGLDLTSFELAVKESLLQRGLKAIPGMEAPSLTLKRDGSTGTDEDLEWREVEHKQAREFTRLGDLLKSRSQFPAAVIEYQKAREKESYSAIILNKLGQSQLLAGQPGDAIRTLEECRELYPDFSTTYYALGEAHLAGNDIEKAVTSYVEVTRINPFHTVAWQRLADLFAKTGRKDEAQRASEKLRILSAADRAPAADRGSSRPAKR
ncbi:MAG: tetratricopeptide repeat protein [Nitrospirae bacterium]|nr:tetratricopeptide repeat protein [Nitrospirota bacterium]